MMLNRFHYCLLVLLFTGLTFAQDSAPKTHVEIQVHSVQGSWRRSKPVPNISFVVLPKGQGPFAEPLASGVTDQDGKAIVRVEVDLGESHRPLVIIKVAQEGMQESFTMSWDSKAAAAEPARYEVQLQVKPGKSFWFRVVDSLDQPVEASWSWRTSDASKRTRSRIHYPSRRFGVGWMRVDMDKLESIDVWAWANGVGGAMAVCTPASEEQTFTRKLKLVGEGVVSGRVLSSAGRPVVNLPLFLRWEGLEMKPGHRFRPSAKLDESLSASGLRFGQCWTDGLGHFELGGLEPGRYELLCGTGSQSWLRWIQIGSKPLLTSEGPVDVQHDRATIEVQLLTAQGKPWTGSQGEQDSTTYSGLGNRTCDFSHWPDSPQLLVRE